jgi:hypothetical protein
MSIEETFQKEIEESQRRFISIFTCADIHFISLGTSQNSIPLLFHILDLRNI